MATVDESRQKAYGLLLNFDSGPMKLAGWAALREANSANDELVLSLMAGSVFLGTLRRDRPRPDVDANLGYSGPPAGFAVPDYGLATFARVCGVEDIAVSVTLAGSRSLQRSLPVTKATAAAAPLGIRHGIGKNTKLADLWLEGSRNLNLRFESSSKSGKSIDGYQATSGKLVCVAADRSFSGHTSIVSFGLLNPFAPLLLVLKGDDGSIDAIDCIPFPSLVRGGWHAAERMIASHGSDELADTATISASLLDAWVARIEQPDLGVATIELDSSVHTGLEPVINEDLLSWVGGSLGIAVRRPGSIDGKEQSDFIDEIIDRHCPPASQPGHTLQIPGDSIPTISALLRLLPANSAAQVVGGGMGIADWNRHGRVWSVWQPTTGKSLESLERRGAPRFAPSLIVNGGDGAEGTGNEALIDWPLAIAYRQQPTRITKNSPLEIAPDQDGPPIGVERQSVRLDASIVILCDRQATSPIPLLESLARQDNLLINNVIICRPHGERDSRLVASAGRLFGARYSVANHALNAGRLEQIKAASSQLQDEIIFIFEAATVLPDSRTASTLGGLLSLPGVTSAGCLIRHADEKMAPASAGYSLTQINLLTAPSVGFDVIDEAVWRAPSTYPVVANSLSALAVKRQFLSSLSADGSSASRPEVDDLQFGIQVIQNAGLNLCTTFVSAFTQSRRPRPTQGAFSIPYRLSPQSLLAITEASTLVQRIS